MDERIFKIFLTKKPLEYRWYIFNADSGRTTAISTTTTPYKKFVFDYGGRYLIGVNTFDGTFGSKQERIEVFVYGPHEKPLPGEEDNR